jgi:DNA replication protein DnaC
MTVEKKDLDNWAVNWNTPTARREVINAPTSMDGMSFDSYRALDRVVPDALIEWLRANLGAKARKSVVLYGEPGVGKTSLGVCALREFASACVGKMFAWNMATAPGVRAAIASGEDKQKPSPVWFERWSRLLAQHRREHWDEAGWFELLDDRVTILMLDDITVETSTQYRESFLLRHIEWAEDRADRALVVTMNESPAELIEKNLLPSRVLDRITEERRFVPVRVGGETLR